MSGSTPASPALEESLESARQLMRVLNLLADVPPPAPDERQRLLAEWAILLGRLDEARLEFDQAGAT